jgi:hypothetical protein
VRGFPVSGCPGDPAIRRSGEQLVRRTGTVCGVNTRTLLRVTVVASGTAAVLAIASPAFAAIHRDDGDDPGPQLNVLQSLLLYIGAPLGLFLLISLLVVAPSIARGPRYRPGLSWWAEPVWFGGPAGSPADAPTLSSVEPTRDGGGASARW